MWLRLTRSKGGTVAVNSDHVIGFVAVKGGTVLRFNSKTGKKSDREKVKESAATIMLQLQAGQIVSSPKPKPKTISTTKSAPDAVSIPRSADGQIPAMTLWFSRQELGRDNDEHAEDGAASRDPFGPNPTFPGTPPGPPTDIDPFDELPPIEEDGESMWDPETDDREERGNIA